MRDCDPHGHAAYGYLDAIHLGQAIAAPTLPTLSKQPVAAGDPPLPNLLQSLSASIEQWSVWPACLLLPLLIALALALMYFFRPRAVSPAQSDGLTVAQQPSRRVSTATVGSTWHDSNRPLDSGEQPQGSQK